MKRIVGLAKSLGRVSVSPISVISMALGGSMARKGFNSISTYGSNTSGMVGYGKRGIDGNNLNTNGLVQGLNNKRRGR